MKFVKVFAIVLIALGLIAGAAWQLFLKEQIAFARTATGFSSKIMCSCRFVAERDRASCDTDFLTDISAVTFEESEDRVTASVLGGLVSSTAAYTEDLGCAVID